MSKTGNITPKEKKRRIPMLFQLLLVVGFLALTWFSFGQNVLAPQKQAAVPERLGKLELVSSNEGSEAMGLISKLHGTDINLVEAYIARYSDDTGHVTIWIGKAENSDRAAELLSMMTKGIVSSNSVFSNLKLLTVTQGYHTHEVFQVNGPGGKHFFYHSRESRETIVWLSIESGDTISILEQAVKTF